MLDKFRETAITWDKANRKVYEPLRVSAGDNKGRKLSVQVVNGGVFENITGSSLSLFWETRDKAHRGLDGFTAVDATKGEFEIYYTTGMLSNEGVLNANLVLVEANGRIVSEPFTITVFRGIDDDAIQSSDSFTALTEALVDISNLEQNYAPRLNDLTVQLQQTVEKSTYEQFEVLTNQQLAHKADTATTRRATDIQPITADEMDTATKALFTGGAVAVVGYNSVGDENLKSKAVRARHTSLVSESANLFDATSEYVLSNSYVDGTGAIVAEVGKNVSDKIHVNAGDVIRFKHDAAFTVSNKGAFYGANDIWLGKITTMATDYTIVGAYSQFTVPANAAISYIKVNFLTTSQNSFMVVKNIAYPSVFVPYRLYLDDKVNIEYKNILNIQEAESVMETGANIFDKDAEGVLTGQYYDGTGVLTASATLNTSAPIAVVPGDVIRFRHDALLTISNKGAIFDKDGNWLNKFSGVAGFAIVQPGTGDYYEFTVPTSAATIRANFSTANVNSFMLTKNEVYPSVYAPFATSLRSDIKVPFEQIIQDPKVEIDFLKYLVKNAITVGDSLTDGGYYGPGWLGEAITESYPYYLARLTDWNITDKAKNGATPTTWWTEFSAGVDFSAHDVVIIGLGTNGGLTDTIDADTAGGVYAATETGQYCRIVNEFRTQNPNCHIFLGKIFGIMVYRDATNAVIEKVALKYNCKLLDDGQYYGDPILHPFGNTLHYGKIGNLHKANLYLSQIKEHIYDNLTDYEVILEP